MQASFKDLFLFILPQPLTIGGLSVILYPMRDTKKAYMKNQTNTALVDHIKGLSTYQKIMREREHQAKRDREIMFETGFPCLVLGVIAGMIIAGMLSKIS